MSRLIQALNARFDDLAEVKDISKYGCSGGISGFIYYHEIRSFYFDHEDDIENKLDELGLSFADVPPNYATYLSGQLTWIVWVIVEEYCHQRLEAQEMALAV